MPASAAIRNGTLLIETSPRATSTDWAAAADPAAPRMQIMAKQDGNAILENFIASSSWGPALGVIARRTVNILRISGPIEIANRIELGLHQAGHIVLGQLRLEQGANRRILVDIFDLVLGPIGDFLRMTVELHRRMHGKITRRR